MGVIPEKSSHCSPLQPTLTWQFQLWGVIPENSSHCSPLLHGNFSQGGNSWKVLPLQPNSYIILPPLNKLPPHSYINLPPIDKLPPILTSKWDDFREDIRPGLAITLATLCQTEQSLLKLDKLNQLRQAWSRTNGNQAYPGRTRLLKPQIYLKRSVKYWFHISGHNINSNYFIYFFLQIQEKCRLKRSVIWCSIISIA